MDNPLKTTDPQPKKRGFFDRPASVDFLMSVGGRFWGGLIIGLGFGLFIASSLVKDELLGPDSGLWLIGWVVLFSIGLAITRRAVCRGAAPGTARSET